MLVAMSSITDRRSVEIQLATFILSEPYSLYPAFLILCHAQAFSLQLLDFAISLLSLKAN